MAANLSALQALRLAQLKSIAVKCGISSSGTKSVLASRILSELAVASIPAHHGAAKTAAATAAASHNVAKRTRWKASDHSSRAMRVLSIDMGIRNLAYCVLDIPPPSLVSQEHAGPSTIPSLVAWKRIAVSPRPSVPSLESTKETFEPHAYASLAYLLLMRTIHSYGPTLVLIERQRYRSAGSPAIQEWTVRVNMFEGMLYAVLHTLQAEGLWSGLVRGVMPGKVGGFWVGGVEKGTAKTAKWRNKTAKIDLLGKWLEAGGDSVLTVATEEARKAAEAFLGRWKGKGKRQKAKTKTETDVVTEGGVEEKMSKLDDLADCLLQGLAWARWEENKLRILSEGVAVLEER
jgi:cruciform cutting endonuclease 1